MGSSSPESQSELTGSQFGEGPPYTLPPLRKDKPSERDKRTYRACLHCRQRKSRCDLYGSGEPGRPPCERCIREQHECILGGSRRGGKRIKRTNSEPESRIESSSTPTQHNPPRSVPSDSNKSSFTSPELSQTRPSAWSTYGSENQMTQPTIQEPQQQGSENEPSSSKMTVDESIASADIQNPSDALEFLANVADRAEGRMLPPIRSSLFDASPSQRLLGHPGKPISSSSAGKLAAGNSINFAPLQKGHMSVEMMLELVNRYEQNYHPFFPLANPAAMDPRQLATFAADEPHLLAAICTIASKDEGQWWHLHEACSAHMQELIAALVYGGSGSVEAVEALLILAEWVPRRPQSAPSIGKGEEDHQAWMLIGTAVRLGYLLELDRTGFRTAVDPPQSSDFNRKRLAWSACYMMDRHVSVRIGKAFWSRGPGPMTGLSAQDFPGLRALRIPSDDYAEIWEANLELTQLFSNAHDVLYSSKNRSSQLNAGGEYVKYIDDFRAAIKAWHNTWGMLTCSPPLKASLILSYEYLRLYINAFAYQATMNRMVVHASEYANNPKPRRGIVAAPFTDFVAATPDARFIYDSVDAAKCILITFNSLVDPVLTFRYMPLRYYLYVIYSACFLYKARSTGVLGGDRNSIKCMISDTVERLQNASACTNDVGDRYSKLIRLLWRKPPPKEVVAPTSMSNYNNSNSNTYDPTQARAGGNANTSGTNTTGQFTNNTTDPQGHSQMHYNSNHQQQQSGMPLTALNTFSWLDLQGVESFATSNNSISGSIMEGLDGFEESPGLIDGVFAPFNQSFLQSGQTSWTGVSPPGIIF